MRQFPGYRCKCTSPTNDSNRTAARRLRRHTATRRTTRGILFFKSVKLMARWTGRIITIWRRDIFVTPVSVRSPPVAGGDDITESLPFVRRLLLLFGASTSSRSSIKHEQNRFRFRVTKLGVWRLCAILRLSVAKTWDKKRRWKTKHRNLLSTNKWAAKTELLCYQKRAQKATVFWRQLHSYCQVCNSCDIVISRLILVLAFLRTINEQKWLFCN